jgi:AcrR family transcriptional regulator
MSPTVSSKKSGWKQDPERVKQNILAVALEEFAEHGYSGARINRIAEKTNTSKRMIYYYFDDKDTLYTTVLSNAYKEVRESEQRLELDSVPAIEAMRALVEFTFHHHARHRHFIRLVAIENIHYAEHIQLTEEFRDLNSPAVQRVHEIYQRGLSEGVFRSGLDPVFIHWQISALCFQNVSNEYTFSKAISDEIWTDMGQIRLRKQIEESVLAIMTV